MHHLLVKNDPDPRGCPIEVEAEELGHSSADGIRSSYIGVHKIAFLVVILLHRLVTARCSSPGGSANASAL
jgi:hypothetical protein